jgi:hypothetical protein
LKGKRLPFDFAPLDYARDRQGWLAPFFGKFGDYRGNEALGVVVFYGFGVKAAISALGPAKRDMDV